MKYNFSTERSAEGKKPGRLARRVRQAEIADLARRAATCPDDILPRLEAALMEFAGADLRSHLYRKYALAAHHSKKLGIIRLIIAARRAGARPWGNR